VLVAELEGQQKQSQIARTLLEPRSQTVSAYHLNRDYQSDTLFNKRIYWSGGDTCQQFI